jgi:HK97 family phage prohead protease
MPIKRCENGKYQIGQGECMYESHASAQRAFVAYLASHPEEADKLREESKKAADMNKVSFDFDDTIELERYQNIAIKLKNEGKTIYIITRRQDTQSKSVYEVADKIGIPHSRVYFTNGKMKWETVKRLGIGIHYDNNPDEIRLINENTDAKGRLINQKSMIYNYKSFDLELKDVDAKKGIVSGYFSAFGMVDSDGDIMMPGAFKRSINDWGPEGKGRIKHLLNHNPSQPLGKITSLKEDSYGLLYTSQIGTHQLGKDFIKMVESGLIGEHSIGFRTLQEQKGEIGNELRDVMLFEGSSLTAWGANENTPLVGMKSLKSVEKMQDEIRAFDKFIRNSDASEETIDLCLIKVKQLAQAIEQMSSTTVVEETPEQPKEVDDRVFIKSLLSILNKY